jgi:hypothetical protein
MEYVVSVELGIRVGNEPCLVGEEIVININSLAWF